MAKINTHHPDYLSADRVRQALQMAGIKPVSGCKYAHEYRINGCGYHYHIHYYVKTFEQAQYTPAVMVIHPFRLDQLQHVFDKVPDAVLCKADLSTSFLKLAPYEGTNSRIGYSVVFKKHRAVADFLKELRSALKAGIVTDEIEPTLTEGQAFISCH